MKTSRALFVTLISVLAVSTVCHAMFMRPELEQVPVARLVKNLEAKLAEDPENPQLVFALARVHSMAYSRKATELQVKKGQDTPWFGFVPHGIPYRVKETKDEEQLAAAAAHLEKAIELHQKAVALKPDFYLARLGLAWCLQQAGKKQEAIKKYRVLIKDALPQDRKMSSRYHGVPTISTEATNYLIKLLDPKTDADEIARLKEQASKTEKRISRMITPIAVAVDRNLRPAEFVDLNTSVRFDLDGSGIQRRWQWIHKEAAWLVYDPQGQGKILSALQMFGNVTFWLFWENGYQAMASLDDNADGRLSGDELRHLALWQDSNQNGVSDTGEVKSLAAHGIVEIDCSFTGEEDGMPHNPRGVTYQDGHTRPSCDVFLRQVD